MGIAVLIVRVICGYVFAFTFAFTGSCGSSLADVHPHVRPNSWMYWTDWEEDEVNDSIGRIERAWMDGSNRSIFVTSNMLWPNGLTLDHGTSTMYWCDAYYDHIERIHLNGTGRMVTCCSSLVGFG